MHSWKMLFPTGLGQAMWTKAVAPLRERCLVHPPLPGEIVIFMSDFAHSNFPPCAVATTR